MKLYPIPSACLPALLLCGILASGCSKPHPPAMPGTAPTAFFDWCQSESFGVKLPQTTMVNSKATNITSGELGFVKYLAWTPCKTDEESRKFLDTTFAALRHKAEEKICACQGIEPHGTGLSLKYRSGRVDGTVVGRCVLRDMPKMGTAYWLELKLTEVVGEQ
jgi:hypothetical protein